MQKAKLRKVRIDRYASVQQMRSLGLLKESALQSEEDLVLLPLNHYRESPSALALPFLRQLCQVIITPTCH